MLNYRVTPLLWCGLSPANIEFSLYFLYLCSHPECELHCPSCFRMFSLSPSASWFGITQASLTLWSNPLWPRDMCFSSSFWADVQWCSCKPKNQVHWQPQLLSRGWGRLANVYYSTLLIVLYKCMQCRWRWENINLLTWIIAEPFWTKYYLRVVDMN